MLMPFAHTFTIELLSAGESLHRQPEMHTEDGLTLGGGHTVRYTDLVSWRCTRDTYVVLLTHVTQ